MTSLRLAHFSDPHLPLADRRPPWRDLMSKRLLGYLSWRRKRRHIHRPEVLAALVADVAAHAPDHTVITGDLTNIALPDEFQRARDWLQGLGDPSRISLIPGNHDATVPMEWQQGLGLWRPWLVGDTDRPTADPTDSDIFPSLTVRGSVAIIGLSTAVPTPIGMASGTIGERQLRRAATLLRQAAGRGQFRVVLLHHPPVETHWGDHYGGERKALRDRSALQAMLATEGAELVLHGHTHCARLSQIAGPKGPIPALAVPSASALPSRHGDPARWHMYEVIHDGSQWHVNVTVRALKGDGFTTAGQYQL